jgi:hypothetical protein
LEDVSILCNVIELFWQRKATKTKGSPFKLQMVLAQSCMNTSTCLCKNPNISIVKGRNWLVGCQLW